MSTTWPPLVEHLFSQSAPRAAARHLNAWRGGNDYRDKVVAEPAAVEDEYQVSPDSILLVDSTASAASFTTVLHTLLHGPPTTLGIDLEWKPDTPHSMHRPSLLQLATATTVWLLDLEAPACCTRILLDAIVALLCSSKHRILGFGLQGDLDRLQMLYVHQQASPLTACRVVDLREACVGAATLPSEAGLAAQLRAWTGKTLNKTMQCSDWAARPLSAAQIAYAAADAMCLHVLDEAIGNRAAGRSDDPRHEISLKARVVADTPGGASRSHITREGVEKECDDAPATRRQAASDVGFELVCAAIASLPCEHADACWLADASAVEGAESAEFATEINALCFTGGSRLGEILVLVPALAKVDLRWLSLVLDHPKRKLRLASDDECVEDFGAIPGRIPPLPLRLGLRVLCDPRLQDATELWGSSCHETLRLVIRKPRFTLPAIAAADAAPAAATMRKSNSHSSLGAISEDHGCNFTWLPSPECWYPTLDDALDVLSAGCDEPMPSQRQHTRSEDSPAANSPDRFSGAVPVTVAAAISSADANAVSIWQAPARVKLIVDPTLSVLARKLRMVGIDCKVAGELLRCQSAIEGCGGSETHSFVGKDGGTRRTPVGLLRVSIDGRTVEAHLRLAALEGRLYVTTARRVKQPAPGATYRLLTATDANKQLAEVLTLLQLSEKVNATTGSRCGICNGDAWQRVKPSEADPGQVPKLMLRKQPIFYRCGVCSQIYWPSKRKARDRAPGADTTDGSCGRGVHESSLRTAGVDEWRPSSRIVMALGSNSKGGGGAMLREAYGLHSTLRILLHPELNAAVYATYQY